MADRKPEHEIFATNFKKYFDRWSKEMKEKGISKGRQEDFAELVPTTRRSVTQWMNAQAKPSKDLIEKICEIFNCTKDNLFTGTHEQQYKYGEVFTKKRHEHFQTYCEAIGLNHDFMKFLKTEIQDELFPIWSPVDFEDNESFDTEYKRMPLSDAFKCDSQNEYQRQTKDGQIVNLQEPDYQFMKDVQNEVISYIEYLFYKRKEEMKKEVERFNAELIKKEGGFLSLAVAGRKKREEFDRFEKYRYADTIQEVLNNAKNNKKK